MESLFWIIDTNSNTNDEIGALGGRKEKPRCELGRRCDVLDLPIEQLGVLIHSNVRRQADAQAC